MGEASIQLPEFVSEDFENKWIPNLSNEEYHGDKTAISSSSLKNILKSPATFYASHIEPPAEPTPAMRLGSLIHLAILEPEKFFSNHVKTPSFGDLRSAANKKAKEEWALSLSKDTVRLSEDEFNQIEKIVNSVQSRRDVCALLKNGFAETSGYFRDPVTGIKCKIRPDFINHECTTLIDIKTTFDCTRDEFSKSIWNYRYDFQMGFYFHGIECITGRRPEYGVYIAIEKKSPYEVGVYIADDPLLKKGGADCRAALDKLAECLKSNQWPAYQRKLEEISLPGWVK